MEPRKDTFNESVSTLVERKVRGWLRGVIDDMRRSSPVQQWLDSLPSVDDHTHDNIVDNVVEVNITTEIASNESEGQTDLSVTDNDNITNTDTANKLDSTPSIDIEDSVDILNDTTLDESVPIEQWKRKPLESGVVTSTPQIGSGNNNKLQRDLSIQSEGYMPKFKNPLLRDASLQSDASGSSGSSVMNVLGARRVDAESVLLALGFGPSEKQQKLQRIPDRFLVPSKLKGISTEKFIKDEQHSMRMHDCGLFGYRGLTGNPHVPPSTIVAKIMECILNDDVTRKDSLTRARMSLGDTRIGPASAIPPRQSSRLQNN